MNRVGFLNVLLSALLVVSSEGLGQSKGALLIRHGGPATSIDFSVTGDTIITFGEGVLRMWRTEDGLQMREYQIECRDPKPTMRLMADCNLIMAFDSTRVLFVNAHDGKIFRVFEQSQAHGTISARDRRITYQTPALLSFGSRILASWVDSREIRLENLVSRSLVRIFRHGSCRFYRVALDRYNKRLAACDEDNQIFVWDIASGILESSFHGSRYLLRDLDFLADGKLLSATDTTGCMKVWSIVSKNLVFDGVDLGIVTSLRDNRILYSWAYGRKPQVRRSRDGSLIGELQWATDRWFPGGLLFGDSLILGVDKGAISGWSTEDGRFVREYVSGVTPRFWTVRILGEKYCLGELADGETTIWRLPQWERIGTLATTSFRLQWIPSLEIFLYANPDQERGVTILRVFDSRLSFLFADTTESESYAAAYDNPPRIFSISRNTGTIKIWGPGEVRSSIDWVHRASGGSAAFSRPEPKFDPSKPPLLTISAISFSEPSGEGFLDAEERGMVTVKVANSGRGPARAVRVRLRLPRIPGQASTPRHLRRCRSSGPVMPCIYPPRSRRQSPSARRN